MRTIRRISRQLNTGKWKALVELARLYAREKEAHLLAFGQDACFAECASDRARCAALATAGYTSAHGLQGRAWKMALKDAYATLNKQWARLAAELRPRIARQGDWSDAQKHYAYWLLKDSHRLAQLMAGRAPLPEHFEIDRAQRKTVQNYLRRVIRRRRGARPHVKVVRSIALDVGMYSVFEQGGVQYIRVMSLTPYRRIVIPLTGRTPLSGNIRLVLDEEKRRVEIHYTAEVKPIGPLAGDPCALDAGVSEVFTDECGHRYGAEFGTILARASEGLCDTGRKRNRLHQIAKQARARGDRAKARRLHRYNLGHKKQRHKRRCRRAEIARQINTAINDVLRQRKPAVIITERLDLHGKAKSKRLARQVNLWARKTLRERIEFKASAGGSRREQVNPAYSSQMCPACGFVHRDNRRGDAFQCRYCGHADDADRVAAHNLKARYGDPQITLWTPKERILAILLDRFTARLESSASAVTVSGRTPGAEWARVHRQPESETTDAILPCARENVGARCDHI